MKNHTILKKHNLFIFTLLILMTTCPIFGQVKVNKKATLNKTKIEAKKEKSGEQMFREILFLEGDFESDIPSVQKEINNVKNLNFENKKKRNEFINNIVSLIKKKDSDFFNFFKKSILSDNPFVIQKAIITGSHLMISSTGLTKEYDLINNFINNEGYKYDFSKEDKINEFKKDIENLKISNNINNNVGMGINVVVHYDVSIVVCYIVAKVHFYALGPNNPNSLERELYTKKIISNY